MNPDNYTHVFKTLFGLPPDADTPPVCGAVLTPAFDRGGGPLAALLGDRRPRCPECERIYNAQTAQVLDVPVVLRIKERS